MNTAVNITEKGKKNNSAVLANCIYEQHHKNQNEKKKRYIGLVSSASLEKANDIKNLSITGCPTKVYLLE